MTQVQHKDMKAQGKTQDFEAQVAKQEENADGYDLNMILYDEEIEKILNC